MRYYSSTATPKTLLSSVNSSATSIALSDLTGLPAQYPYTLVIDPDTASEEIVTVTAFVTGTTLTVTRGQDGSSASSHSAGAAIRHMATARDFQESQNHIAATESVHGIADTAFLVTRNGVETLTNKNLTSGTNTFPSSLVTATGTQTLTNKTIDYNSNTITNLPIPQGTSSVPDILMLGGM